MTSELRRVRARFADDNPLLYLSLGLLASFDTLDRLLAAHAPEPLLEAQARTEGSGPDSTAVHFVLGLIALRARVEARLGEAAGSDAAPPTTTGSSFDERGESLWR